ncbi:MAG: HTTM domain-containing protein [Planctomycetota bacterium]
MRRQRLQPLFTPVDAAWFTALRVGFGLLMLGHAVSYLAAGRVRRFWIEPSFHFTFPGFEWVQPWPGDGMILHFWALAALALGIAAGVAYRWCTALFGAAFTYVFLLDQARYQNHTYLICLLALLLIFVPRPRGGTLPRWTLWLFRFQVGIPYFFGGIAKLNPDWLRGEPLREWLPRSKDLAVIGPYLEHAWAPWLFSYGGLTLDLAAVPLLLWRRTRAATFVVLVLFHGMNSQLFSIGVFPWLMIALTTVFFEPGWPRRLLPSWPRPSQLGPPQLLPPPLGRPPSGPPGLRAVTAGALVSWMLVQILIPVRHFAIPGDVAWTKEGQRFAWHMKLNDTDGHVELVMHDPTGERPPRRVAPADTLAPWQVARMSGRPHMIHQFARHLARRGIGTESHAVEIHARARASLNGRPLQWLVDPAVNLARQPRVTGLLEHAPWIVPLRVGPSRGRLFAGR